MSASDHTSAVAASAALARIDSGDDRSLYASPDYGPLVRDLDLAAWAQMSEHRTIRRSIAAAIRDGSVILAGSGMTPPATDAPVVLEYVDTVPRGNRGAVQECRGWYLSEGAAMLVAARLRTQPAQSLTRAALAAFASTRRATVPATLAPAPVSTSAADLDRLVATVGSLVGIVGQLAASVATLTARSMPALPAPAPAQPPPALPAPAPAPPPVAHMDPQPPPDAWLSPTSIATRATHALQRPVSAQRVGRTLTTLGVRERGPSVARCVLVSRQTRSGALDVAAWRFHPSIAAEVIAAIRSEDEAVRTGAAGVLAAIKTTAPDADPRQLSIPIPRPHSASRRAA